MKELIQHVRASIVRLSLFKDREQVGSGSGFLAGGFLITCSHVLRQHRFDAIEITFGDHNINEITPIKYSSEFILNSIAGESPESEYDFAIVRFDEPELQGRCRLEVRTFKEETVGEQVLFFGFPFGTHHLTSHVGYISADFKRDNIHVFQIDGSINPGNSGGPLIHVPSASVIGIVTRTETGLERDFDTLVEALRNNIAILERSRQSGMQVQIAGIDPVVSFRATMGILSKLSFNIKRSANVGIGFSFSSEHILQTGLIKDSA